MRLISLALMSATLVVAMPATAKTQAEPEQSAAGKDAEKKICKKLTITGSRMGERVCLTASQWKKVEEVK